MTDDQGWGDVAYNGNSVVRTPNLDAMATDGVRLDRFYAAAPVCSPTRGSCLTGRHPFRYGIPWAGEGHLPHDEVTIAGSLKALGYETGHFGKWHVGQLSRTVVQNEFGVPADPSRYAPPWVHGFDECFSTESMMPTYNPYYYDGGALDAPGYRPIMDRPVAFGDTSGTRWPGPYPSLYWTGPGAVVDENLSGDDSSIIMDRALDFLGRCIESGDPAFLCVWFHAPHTPVVAGDDMRAYYPDRPVREQHWYGCLSALDAQVGRLRAFLRAHGIAEDTIVWFCSDNGPSWVHDLNSAGPFRGKKGSLLEGGVRVPSVVEWPSKLSGGRAIKTPLVTSDFFPTLLAAAGAPEPDGIELDGMNALPVLQGVQTQRSSAIGFQSPIRTGDSWRHREDVLQMAWSDDRYKLLTLDGGSAWSLYDLDEDEAEAHDLAPELNELAEDMKAELADWVERCTASSERLREMRI
jgi:arylsulfatase A-like enzyme